MQKQYLKIVEAAGRLGCVEVNIYHHVKTGALKLVDLPTYAKTDKGFQLTGYNRKMITMESLEAYLEGKGKVRRKWKQIKARFLPGVDKVFENGLKSIVFPSETVAAEKLEIGKFALRGRLKKGSLIRNEISVSIL